MIELPDRTFIHGKHGRQLIEAQSHQREAPAEGRQRLAEDRILLALQLRQQSGDGLAAGLVDAAGGNQLIDQVLDVLSADSGERGRRNVEKIEIVWDVQPDVPSVAVAYLEDFQIEHDFRPGAVQLSQKLGCGFQRRLRSAHRDSARRGVEAHELEFEERPQRVHQLLQLLRGTHVRDVERAQAHAIEEAVVLLSLGAGKKNGVFECDAKAFSGCGGCLHGGCEICVLQVESHAAAGEVVVEDYRQPIARGDRSDETTRVTSVVDVMVPVDGFGGERVGTGDHLRGACGVNWRGSQGVEYALLGEFVLWIEIQRGSELRQRLHLPAGEQVAVSAFQMQPGQMLSRNLPRSKVLDVLWDQARRFLKFVKGLVEILQILVLRFLEFEAAREGLASGFQVFLGTVADGRAAGIGTERWSGYRSVRGQTHSGQQQTNSC